MGPHATAGTDCTHSDGYQSRWSLCSRAIAVRTGSAGVPHSHDAMPSRWSATLARRPLTLEFYTRATPCLSRWSSTLARCHSPECRRWLHPALKRCTASAAKLSCFTADSAHVRFRATWCISHETVVRYCRRSPRSAFEQRVASAMRPSCITADGSHVLLSSDVVYQQ